MKLPAHLFGGAAARRGRAAFSLLEVMIALAILFMVCFTVLAVVSAGLRNARLLKLTRPNAGILAAELSLTNVVEEGIESGDFGDLYPDYTWTREIVEAGTNGYYRADFAIFQRGQRGQPDSTLTIWIYRPGSPSRRLGVQPAP
ncbi:MAG: prepilin-type N-terminal cleavage/methylation domain-containing protein [Limisphaerales bacterium]